MSKNYHSLKMFNCLKPQEIMASYYKFFRVNLSTNFYPFKPTKVTKATKNLHIGSPQFCPAPPPGCLGQTLPPWPEGQSCGSFTV